MELNKRCWFGDLMLEVIKKELDEELGRETVREIEKEVEEELKGKRKLRDILEDQSRRTRD